MSVWDKLGPVLSHMEKKKQIRKTFQKKQYWSWDQRKGSPPRWRLPQVLFPQQMSGASEVQGARVNSSSAVPAQGWKLASSTGVSCEGIRQRAGDADRIQGSMCGPMCRLHS